MTDTEKKIFESFLTKTLNIAAEDMAGLYNDAGELTDVSIALKADTERVKKLKEDTSSQFKRGIKEGAEKIEKEIREKYGVEDSELIGLELIESVITQKTQGNNKEDITAHPEYIKLRTESEKQLKLKDKELDKKLAEKDAEYARERSLGKVKEKALTLLEGLNPILPSDAKKAALWKNKFLEEISRFSYQEQKDDYVPIGADGKPAEDNHARLLTFDEHIQSIASGMFEFRAADDRSSSGNKPPVKADVKYKGQEDYVEKLRLAKTEDEKKEIRLNYAKQLKS